MSNTIVEKKTKLKDSIKAPGKFKVIICNDDVTPVEFVISMLISVFRHTDKSAVELTLKIHNENQKGVYDVCGFTNLFEILIILKAIDGYK